MKCFECSSKASENHHVVPLSLGGSKTVPLCHTCHSKAHGVENRSIQELTKHALRKLAQSGKVYGGPMYGYDNVNGALFINKEEREEIKQIYLRREMGWSYGKIAKNLNDRGVKTKTGKDWFPITVWNLLNREKLLPTHFDLEGA